MKKIITFIFALTLMAAFTGCKSSENYKVDAPNSSVAEEPADFEKVSLGDFKAIDFNESEVTKDIFSEYDLTMVNLWTTTCSYCIEEMPALNRIREELQEAGKSFNIISVCMDVGNTVQINDDNLKIAKEIIEKAGVSYPNLIPDKVLLEGRLNGIQAFPESFFVDSEGNVVSEPYVGAKSENHWKVTIQSELEKALKDKE